MKAHLERYLDLAHDSLLWKLEGLSEYDLRRPDEILIARLKKLKLVIKDEIAAWSSEAGGSRAA